MAARPSTRQKRRSVSVDGEVSVLNTTQQLALFFSDRDWQPYEFWTILVPNHLCPPPPRLISSVSWDETARTGRRTSRRSSRPASGCASPASTRTATSAPWPRGTCNSRVKFNTSRRLSTLWNATYLPYSGRRTRCWCAGENYHRNTPFVFLFFPFAHFSCLKRNSPSCSLVDELWAFTFELDTTDETMSKLKNAEFKSRSKKILCSHRALRWSKRKKWFVPWG